MQISQEKMRLLMLFALALVPLSRFAFLPLETGDEARFVWLRLDSYAKGDSNPLFDKEWSGHDAPVAAITYLSAYVLGGLPAVHLLASLLIASTAVLLYIFLKGKLGERAAAAGFLFFISFYPVYLAFSNLADTRPIFLFFSMLAVYLLGREKKEFLLPAGLAAAAAILSNEAGVLLPIAFLASKFLQTPHGRFLDNRLKAFMLAAFAPLLVWIARNLVFFGYPLFTLVRVEASEASINIQTNLAYYFGLLSGGFLGTLLVLSALAALAFAFKESREKLSLQATWLVFLSGLLLVSPFAEARYIAILALPLCALAGAAYSKIDPISENWLFAAVFLLFWFIHPYLALLSSAVLAILAFAFSKKQQAPPAAKILVAVIAFSIVAWHLAMSAILVSNLAKATAVHREIGELIGAKPASIPAKSNLVYAVGQGVVLFPEYKYYVKGDDVNLTTMYSLPPGEKPRPLVTSLRFKNQPLDTWVFFADKQLARELVGNAQFVAMAGKDNYAFDAISESGKFIEENRFEKSAVLFDVCSIAQMHSLNCLFTGIEFKKEAYFFRRTNN